MLNTVQCRKMSASLFAIMATSTFKWVCHAGSEAYKTRLAYSVTIRISAQNNFMLLLKHFITKVLEYKAEELNLYALLCVP